MRYAQVEIDSGNTDRARSVFERALTVDYSYVPLWLRYAQMEVLQRQFSHARAIYERSVTLLVHETKLWLTYIEMEELLDNIDACLALLERWTLTGSAVAWKTWYNFAKRHRGDTLDVLERWVAQGPQELQAWTLLARETDARTAYSRAIDTNMLSDDEKKEVFALWSAYEAAQNEPARAKALLEIGGVQMASRDFSKLDYSDVESWWAEISVREKDSDAATLNAAFEFALLKCAPQDTSQKTDEWRKYALLWLRYAMHAERNAEPAARIYEAALAHWPHASFTSATLWRAYAEYEVRQNNIAQARRIYGSALGKTQGSSSRIFDYYIQLEKRLLSTDTVRKLYSKYCCVCAHSAQAWREYASFEASLEEFERARSIFEVAVTFSVNDPDALWLAWAEMEADSGDFDRARDVWNEYLRRGPVDVVNIWTQYAMFEVSTGLGDDEDEADNEAVERARAVFTRAFEELRQRKAERLQLYELFVQFEESYGTSETLDSLRQKAPQPVTRTDGSGTTYVAYEFPEVKETSAISKLLANAKKWAQASGADI